MFIPIWALFCGVVLLAVNLVLDLCRFSRGGRGSVSVKLADGVSVSASSVEDFDRLVSRVAMLRWHASRAPRAPYANR